MESLRWMVALAWLAGCGPSAEEIAKATADEQERREAEKAAEAAKVHAEAEASAQLESSGDLWADIATEKFPEGLFARSSYEASCGGCHGTYGQGGTAGSIRAALRRLSEAQLVDAMVASGHPEAVRSQVPDAQAWEQRRPHVARYLKEVSAGWNP